nr:hypothetical protein [Bacteroidota bacterium]
MPKGINMDAKTNSNNDTAINVLAVNDSEIDFRLLLIIRGISKSTNINFLK